MMLAVDAGTWTQLADYARAMGVQAVPGTGSSAFHFPGLEWSNPLPYVVQIAPVSGAQGSCVVLKQKGDRSKDHPPEFHGQNFVDGSAEGCGEP